MVTYPLPSLVRKVSLSSSSHTQIGGGRRADSGAREHAARDLPGAWMGQIRVMQRLPRARSPEPSVIAGEICLPPPQWLPRARSPRHGGRKRRAVSGPAPCRSRSAAAAAAAEQRGRCGESPWCLRGADPRCAEA
ncbi:hypothetical protein U9M48_037183 [Paspalum notatum var. saurae]|uniref:Uncharacterized protein n=1 Tax=Paspalum notatum var. saurae TaxID=547442 RepID=A0AAQ3UJ46_PASNO